VSFGDLPYRERVRLAVAARISGRGLGVALIGGGPRVPVEMLPTTSHRSQFDIFVSYSSTEKQSLVLPLVTELSKRDISSWFDVHEVALGDSIVTELQRGMSSSALILAIISPEYLRRPWPLKELRTALALETAKQVSILPVLVGVTYNEVCRELPFLAEIRHFAIPQLPASEVVSAELLQQLVGEIVTSIGKRLRVELFQAYDVGQLTGSLRLVRYDSEYTTVTCVTDTQFLDVLCRPRIPGARRYPVMVAEPAAIPAILKRVLKASGRGTRTFVKDVDLVGNLLVIALSDGNVVCSGSGHFRDGQLDRIEYIETGSSHDPIIMQLTPDLDVITGYEDGELRVTPLVGAGHRGRVLEAHRSAIRGIGSSKRSRLFVIADPGELSVWSRDKYELFSFTDRLDSPGCSIAVSTSPIDRIVGIGHVDGSISIWTFDGIFQSRFRTGGSGIDAIKFLPGPGKFLVAGGCGGLAVWDYDAGTRVCELSAAQSTTTSLDCEPFDEGAGCAHSVVAAGFGDGCCKVWELRVH